MKNIITIATLLAAGTLSGFAASKGYNSLDESLKSNVYVAWDFSGNSSTPVAGASAWNSNNTFTVESGKAKLSSSDGNRPWKSGIGNSFSNGDFTLSFDVYSFTANNWQTMVSLYSKSTSSGDNDSLQLFADTSGKLSLGNKVGGASAFAGIDTSNNLETGLTSGFSGQSTVTIVSDMSSSKTLKLYVDGKEKAKWDNWTASADQALTGIQFGAAFGNKRQFPSAEIGNITLWTKALSQSEVGSLIVPEPSAFGLLAGLGALALVGARRRRSRK